MRGICFLFNTKISSQRHCNSYVFRWLNSKETSATKNFSKLVKSTGCVTKRTTHFVQTQLPAPAFSNIQLKGCTYQSFPSSSTWFFQLEPPPVLKRVSVNCCWVPRWHLKYTIVAYLETWWTELSPLSCISGITTNFCTIPFSVSSTN